MHSRRAFLGGLVLGPTSITASQTVVTQQTPESAVQFLAPMCPACCCLFDVTTIHPNRETRVADGLKPIAVTCQYCEWQGNVTFFRRL